MTPTSLSLHRDGLVLEADHWGPRDAPLVMLVHGFPDTPHSWRAMVPGLLAAGYQVLAPWLRGYTDRSANFRSAYGPLPASRDVRAWRDHLAAPETHLVGHDWGAVIALIIVADDAQNWKTLSLLAIPPMPRAGVIAAALKSLPRQLWHSRYMLRMQQPSAAELLSANHGAYVAEMWRRWSPGWEFDEATVAPAQAVFSSPRRAWAATRYYRAMFTLHRRETRETWMKFFTDLRLPTLAVAGERDGCFHPGTHRALVPIPDTRPNLHGIRLPDCGHFVQMECPQAVLDALLQHFAAQKKPPEGGSI